MEAAKASLGIALQMVGSRVELLLAMQPSPAICLERWKQLYNVTIGMIKDARKRKRPSKGIKISIRSRCHVNEIEVAKGQENSASRWAANG